MDDNYDTYKTPTIEIDQFVFLNTRLTIYFFLELHHVQSHIKTKTLVWKQ
jgi:hypothetical protein